MNHLAIMDKRWGMIEKIISGEKTIESRWLSRKICPWNCLNVGDRIFFRNSGEKSIEAIARTAKIEQLEITSEGQVKEILAKKYKDLGITQEELGKFFEILKNKKYLLLIHLDAPEVLGRSLVVDKSKFGASPMASWVCDIGQEN